MNKERCSNCGYDKHKGSLHIHHVDGNHDNNSERNLIVLCANCHFEIHANRTKEQIDKSKCHRLKAEMQKLIELHNIAITQYRKEKEELDRQLTAHVPMR